jgi:hypothetical protein
VLACAWRVLVAVQLDVRARVLHSHPSWPSCVCHKHPPDWNTCHLPAWCVCISTQLLSLPA